MRGRRHLGFVAAAATLLAAAPLSAIFERWTWLLQSMIAVALVAGVATLTRSLRAPVWAQGLGMLGALLIALTWLFPSGSELLGILPTPGTFAHFGTLLNGSAADMQSYGVKVPDTKPLLFVTVLGVGVVAVVVDLLTVGLRRPALAGLPMLAIYSVPVAVYVNSVPPVPFVIGAIGFLWLLVADNVNRVRHFGRRFTGDGRDVDIWEPSPLAAAGRRLAVVGVVLAVLLPLAAPEMTSGLLNRFSTGTGTGAGEGSGRAGQGRGVELFAALSGQLNQTETREYLKVTTTDPNPFYLRFGVADQLRSAGFDDRAPSGQALNRLPDPREAATPGVSFQQYRAQVEVTNNFDMPLLPIYTDPVATQALDGNWLYDREKQVIFSNRRQSKGKKYSFDYVRAQYTPAVLNAAPSLPPNDPIRKQFTTVPLPRVQQVEELVARLTEGKRTDYAKVRGIYDYFSQENGFSYNLSTKGGTGGEDIVNFLNSKVGFCQQYASAMAWLVRAAGVPSRVAFGFTNGSSKRDNTSTLTNLNLHAWTEVYFAGVGWVPFDATPAASVIGSTRTDWAPNTDAPEPVASAGAASTAAPGVDASAGPNAVDPLDRGLTEGSAGASGAVETKAPAWPWWTLGGVLALLALLAVPALRRDALRRRRQLRAAAATATATTVAGDPAPGVARVVVTGAEADRARADAHAAWDELVDTMVDFRVQVDLTETPRATADRLVTEGLTDAAADAARLLGRAEERARYARAPLPTGELNPAIRSIRQALAAGSDRRTRFLAATLPPSVLLHWRLAIMDGSGRFVTVSSQLREALLRWSPRRLLANRAR
jgi:transglutaminase-like putative cysteine protease